MIAVLAIAIFFLFLGSVSAADNTIDANLTANDNSLEISELNEANVADDVSTVGDSVGDVDVLKSYDYLNQYCDEETTLTVTTEDSTTVNVGDSANIHVEWRSVDKQFSQGSPNSETRMIYLYNGDSLIDSKSPTYISIDYYQGTAYLAADFSVNFDSAGTWNINARTDKIYNGGGTYSYGAAKSENLIFNVGDSSSTSKDTAVSLTVPSTGTVGEAVDIEWQVTEKDSTAGVSTGTLTFYEGNNQIGSPVDLTSSSGTFTHTFTSSATYNIKAVYTAAEGYADSESDVSQIVISDSGSSSGGDNPVSDGITLKITDAYSKYDGQSSSSHYPYTDDFALISCTGTNSKYSTVVTFKVEGASSSAKIKYGGSEQSLSGDTFSLEFTSNDAGENTIYIIDESKKSNDVTVKVVTGANKIGSLSVDPEWGVEGQTITITPTAISAGTSSADDYTSRPISGYVTFYSSNSLTDENKIATVSTEGGSFTVPLIDAAEECDYITLYYTFTGEYNNNGFVHGSSNYLSFLVLNSNPIALTGNGQTGNVETDSENKVTLHVTPTYYMNDGSDSFIEVYVGTEKVGTFTAVSATSVSDYVLDLTGYDAGAYDVYVKYLGYNYEDSSNNVYYHAANESNHLTVNIAGSTPVSNVIRISVTNTTYGNTVATVIAGQAGTYTLKINNADYKTDIVFSEAGSQTIPITGYAASDSQYSAVIEDNSDSSLYNSTVFTIARADANLQVSVVGNNTQISETHSITVTANGKGKVKVNNVEYDLGEIQLTGLTTGINSISVEYLGDENYTGDNETLYININSPEVETTVELILDSNELSSVGKIVLTAKVNGGEVTEGTIKVYTDMYASQDPVATFDVNGYANFTDSTYNPGSKGLLYAKYMGATIGGVVYKESPLTDKYEYVRVQTNSITLSLSKDLIYEGQSVTVTPTVNGNGVITLSIGGKDNGTITKDGKEFTFTKSGTYTFNATYTMSSDDYYASCVSEPVTLTVEEMTAPEITITLSNSSVSKDGTLSVTPEIITKDGAATSGTVEFYDENNQLLGSIDLSEKTSFDYTVVSEKGTTHSIYAKFISPDYAETISEAVSYKIRKDLTITLARNGEGIVKVGDKVEFTITYSDSVSENLELWVNDTKFGSEDGSASTSVTFDAGYVGENRVFIKFLGNDDFDACESNSVSVNVAKPLATTVSIDITPQNVENGKNISITPTVLDENGNPVIIGTVKIYTSQYYTNFDPVASVEAGKSVEYAVPDAYVGTTVYLYAVYFGESADDVIYAKSDVSQGVAYTIVEKSKKDITLTVTVDEEKEDDDRYDGEYGDSFDVVTEANETLSGVIIYKENGVEIGRADIGEIFELDELSLGEHTITAVFEGNDDYNMSEYTFYVNIIKKTIWYTLTIDNVNYPGHAVGKLYASDVEGTYNITIDGKNYTVEFEWTDVDVPVTFDIDQLPVGIYTPSTIYFEDMDNYEFGESEREGQNILPTFEILKATEPYIDTELNSSVLSVSNGTSPEFSIDLPGASGNLTVKVGDNVYTKELVDGKATVVITDLAADNYTATVTYSGDDNYKSSSVESKFTVEASINPSVNDTLMNVDVPAGSTNPVFSINLSADATGNLTVKIGDNTYTKELVNGSATITVDDLLPGAYNATVSYEGNYPSMSKNTTFTVPTPKLSGKNINVVYSGNAIYKVLVTADGKAVVGEKVAIRFNGKTYNVKTDKNGYASLKLKTKIKVKTYTITATFKGVKVTSKVSVKHILKIKTKKIKKSRKVVKFKVKTKKVNGKYLKGKKLKLKIKGKTLKAKINKKGVATFKIKKNVLEKLKAGKKYKVIVTYGKEKVSKKIKVKR